MKRIKFLFAWYDFWIDVFVDKPKKKVYIFLLPILGIVIDYRSSLELIFLMREEENIRKQRLEDDRIERHIRNTAYLRWRKYLQCFNGDEVFIINLADECTLYNIHHESSAQFKDTSIIPKLINECFEALKKEFTSFNL